MGLWTESQSKKSGLGKLDLRGSGNEEKEEDILGGGAIVR